MTVSEHSDQSAGGGSALLGREAELAELRGALEQARAGRGALVLLRGDPGIGKTSLIDAVALEAEREGCRVLWGRCWEGGGAPAYWPWVQIVRDWTRRVDDAELIRTLDRIPGAALIAQLVPELRERARALTVVSAQESDEARFALFDAIASLLVELASCAPLMLVLEDLHAADQPTLLLAQFLAGELRRAPILAVGSYREPEARQRPEIGATLATLATVARQISLVGLQPTAVAALIAARTGSSAPPALAAAIADATAGNPFFVDEMVRLLVAEHGPQLTEPRAEHDLPLPDSVREAVRRRLIPLAPRTLAVLSVAAIVGGEFRLATLEALGELGLHDALDAAEEAGLIVGVGPGRYAFAHALLRETLVAELTPTRRAELHRAVGEALERSYSADTDAHLAELAHHFLAAARDDSGRAIDYAMRAGNRAMAMFAYEQAVRHYEEGLAALELGAPDDRASGALLQALGGARMLSGDTAGGRRALEQAMKLARRNGDAELFARAALNVGAIGFYSQGGVDDLLVDSLEEALRGLPPGDSALRARCLGRLAQALFFSEHTQRRRELGEQAVATARRLGDPEILGHVLAQSHAARWTPTNLDERLDETAEQLALAERAGDAGLEINAYDLRFNHLLEAGDLVGADDALEHYVVLAERLRTPHSRWHRPTLLAMRAMLAGRFDELAEHHREFSDLGPAPEGLTAPLLHTAQSFFLCWQRGGVGQLGPLLERFVRRFPAIAGWRAALLAVRAEAGREDELRRTFAELAVDRFAALARDNIWAPALGVLTPICVALEDLEQAGVLYELLAPLAGRAIVSPGAAVLGPADDALGQLAMARGDLDRAGAHFERAAVLARELQSPPLEAIVGAHHASLLAALGDAAGARELTGSALAISQRLALAPTERLALAVLERVGVAGARGGGAPRGAGASRGGVAGAQAGRVSSADRPERGVLRREGDVWTISAGGVTCRLRDAKGLRYLARLLDSPGVEMHALDLAAGGTSGGGGAVGGAGGSSGSIGHPGAAGGAAAAAAAASAAGLSVGADDAGPLLDEAAKRAYRARVGELQEELDEAERFHDPERAERARAELELVATELARAVGIGGHDRRAASNAERARVNVTRAIKSVLRRIGDQDAALGRRLTRSVRTGAFCAFEPDPDDPVRWEVNGGG